MTLSQKEKTLVHHEIHVHESWVYSMRVSDTLNKHGYEEDSTVMEACLTLFFKKTTGV